MAGNLYKMLQNMNNTIILLTSLILLAGCASAPRPRTETVAPRPPDAATSGQPADSAGGGASGKGWAILSADVWMKASMKIAFPDLNRNISATIEIAKMDSVLVSLSAMFGISVGKLFATPSEFIMNNNLENTTYTGQPTRENLMKAAFIDLSYRDLLCALKCAPPQPFDKYRLNLATGTYTYEEDTFLESIYFEGELLSKVVRTDKAGNELLVINYSKHNRVGEHWLAGNIWVAFPQANGSINIALTDIQLNHKLTSPMRLVVPRAYELIDF